DDGRLRWVSTGAMPVPAATGSGTARGTVTADRLLGMLNQVAERYDRLGGGTAQGAEPGPGPGPGPGMEQALAPAGSAVAP
ncbi:MAG TPA: hypothetical protein VD813_15115, partial [Pseudonocardia sp.]|nr:hypothetical protein [Pseudonocardia sp.]